MPMPDLPVQKTHRRFSTLFQNPREGLRNAGDMKNFSRKNLLWGIAINVIVMYTIGEWSKVAQMYTKVVEHGAV